MKESNAMKREVGFEMGINPDGDPNGLIGQELRKSKNQRSKPSKGSPGSKQREIREWTHRMQRKVKKQLSPSRKTARKYSSTAVPKKITTLNDCDTGLNSARCQKPTKEVIKLEETKNPKQNREEKKEIEKLNECVSCLDKFQLSDITKIPCAHLYCQNCITRVYELFIGDETSTPPQCCGKAMESLKIAGVIGLDMAKSYEDRKTELSDPNKNYCSNPECSRYILPRNIRRQVGACEHCMTRTCVKCGKSKHRGDCRDENDLNDDLLEDLAREKKWQRCSKCSRIIERTYGCFHISCPCGFHFCYVCSQKQGSCKCLSLDQSQLHPRGA